MWFESNGRAGLVWRESNPCRSYRSLGEIVRWVAMNRALLTELACACSKNEMRPSDLGSTRSH